MHIFYIDYLSFNKCFNLKKSLFMCCRFNETDVYVTMGIIPCMIRTVADDRIICETIGVEDTLATKVQVTHVSHGDSIEVNINTLPDATRRYPTLPDATVGSPTYTAHDCLISTLLKYIIYSLLRIHYACFHLLYVLL